MRSPHRPVSLFAEFLNPFLLFDLIDPGLRNGVIPVVQGGKASGNGAGGIGIPAEIDDLQEGFPEGFRGDERPNDGLKRFDNIATALDFLRGGLPESREIPEAGVVFQLVRICLCFFIAGETGVEPVLKAPDEASFSVQDSVCHKTVKGYAHGSGCRRRESL